MNQDILSEIKNQDYTTIIQNIEEFIEEKIRSTNSEGVVLGLSGGIDSALIAYICKNKFKGKILALIMPDTDITPPSETDDAMKMISLTGIEYKLIDIKPILREYSMYIEPNSKAKGNLRARIRTNILYYYANIRNYLVLGSSDKSEFNIGYFTKFGDGASDLTPIISLYKLQVREASKILGVPQNVIEKKSSPHLWKDHEAEKELEMSYEEIDSILYCLIEKKMTGDEIQKTTEIEIEKINKILDLHKKSQHKRIYPLRLDDEK